MVSPVAVWSTLIVTRTLAPAASVPDDGCTRSWCDRLPDTAIDQSTGPPCAVSVIDKPPGGTTSVPPAGVTTSVPAVGVGVGVGDGVGGVGRVAEDGPAVLVERIRVPVVGLGEPFGAVGRDGRDDLALPHVHTVAAAAFR